MFNGVTTGLRALGTNPMRTALSTLGVVIGVASLVTILALGDGLERFTRQQIERTTDLQAIQITPRTVRVVDGLAVELDSVRTLGRSDVDTLAALLGPGFAVTRTRNRSARALAPDSTRATPLYVLGYDPLIEGVQADAVAEGAFPVENGTPSAVLSAAAARVFFPDGSAAGRTLRLDSLDFRVAGVLEGDSARRPIRVFVELGPDTEAWLSASDRPAAIIVRAHRIEDVEEGLRTIDAWVTRDGSKDRVVVESSRGRVAQARQAMLVFKLALAAIAAVSLIVGGIGIMNVLLASVSERTREIGVRKAAGARPADIRHQFLAESVAIAGLGSLLGVIVGMAAAVGIAAVIRSISEAPVSAAFTWPSILAAAAAALVVGLAFGTYPARKAARLSPIDAIRHE